jgi:flagellar hook assembly protein FlgD
MKKFTMTVAMFVIVMSAAIASGNGSKSVRADVLPGKDQVYKVIYSAKESGVVKIRIRDEKGTLIRTDRVKSEGGFLVPYNMSSMDNGKYVIEITDKLGTVSKEIEITSSKSLAVKLLENKRYQLSVESLRKTALSISIFDKTGTLVHQENHENSNGFSRIYDLSKFDSDSFIFELNGVESSQELAVK